jgi:hypothetical protein
VGPLRQAVADPVVPQGAGEGELPGQGAVLPEDLEQAWIRRLHGGEEACAKGGPHKKTGCGETHGFLLDRCLNTGMNKEAKKKR